MTVNPSFDSSASLECPLEKDQILVSTLILELEGIDGLTDCVFNCSASLEMRLEVKAAVLETSQGQ